LHQAEKPNAVAPFAVCFNDEQADTIKDCVSALSALSVEITQSSKSLCKVPKHANFRLIHSLAVSLITLAGSSVLCLTGVFVPAFGIAATLIGVLGAAGFYAYGRSKKKEVKQWQARLNKITNTTKLEKFKEDVMNNSFKVQGATLAAQRTDINRIDIHQQSQAAKTSRFRGKISAANRNESKAFR
jgi:phosphoglycerol transferase MdoB-like AlkP superfamily enzyme